MSGEGCRRKRPFSNLSYTRGIGICLEGLRETAEIPQHNNSRDQYLNLGHAVAQLVEALRYKPEGHGFDSRWCRWNFSLT
jgi:hypothetical protein